MNHIPPELYLFLQGLDRSEHLTRQSRLRIAEAVARAERDRLALERAWKMLNTAVLAESRSRTELLALTS